MAVWVLRLIPAYTGQIAEAVRTGNSPPIHPRIYGADTKLLKKISEIAEHPLLPQNPMIESVCIVFLKCIFADNTFWLFSMFFCKKRDAGGTSFLVCFLVMTFFFCLHSSRILRSTFSSSCFCYIFGMALPWAGKEVFCGWKNQALYGQGPVVRWGKDETWGCLLIRYQTFLSHCRFLSLIQPDYLALFPRYTLLLRIFLLGVSSLEST